MSHAKLDEHLQLFPEVTGVPKGANRKNKQEYLAATNFLVYHGNDEARMQALSDEELQTLNTMFSHSRSVDRDEILANIKTLTDRQAAHNDPASADSSGTDQQQRDDDHGGKSDEEEANTAQKTKSGSSKRRRHETKASTRRSSSEDDDDDDESFSDDSEEESPESHRKQRAHAKSSTRPGKKPARKQQPKGLFVEKVDSADDSSSTSDDSSSESTRSSRRRKHARARRARAGRISSSSESGSARHDNGEGRSTRGKGSTPSTDRTSSPERTSARIADRPSARRGQRRIVAGNGDTSSEPPSDDGVDERRRRSSSREDQRTGRRVETNTSRSGRGQRQRSDRTSARSTTSRRKHKARTSSDSDDAPSSSSEDRLTATRPTHFLKLNKAYAAAATAGCGCALCKVYKHLEKHDGKAIIRSATRLIGTFRKPSSKAKIKVLREWAAMLFWCGHRPANVQWKDLHKAEQQYIITCLVTPSSWSSGVKEAFGRSSTEAVWSEVQARAKKRGGERHSSSWSSPTSTHLLASPESPTRRAHGKAALFAKINTLRFNAGEWLTADELKEVQKATKLAKLNLSGPVGTSSTQPAYKLPYTESPHEQPLMWPMHKPVSFEQAGRMLNVASRVSSAAFNDPVEKIAHNAREEANKTLYAEFDDARRRRDTGGVLLAVEKARSLITDTLEGAVAASSIWLRDYPCTELADIVEGRKKQLSEISAFFVAISKGVSIGAESQKASVKPTYILGAWTSFFDGLRAGRHSSALTASTLKRGRKRLSSDKEHSSSNNDSGEISSDDADGDDSDAARRRRRKAGDRKKRQIKPKTRNDGKDGSAQAKRNAPGKATSSSSKMHCRKGTHFPCSATIIGPKLGVACSANGACKGCQKAGHWTGECPTAWAASGTPLPGYSPNGKRYKEDWDADRNPRVDCIKEWVKFLKNKKHFPNGGKAATEPHAPALSDFEAWVGQAQ